MEEIRVSGDAQNVCAITIVGGWCYYGCRDEKGLGGVRLGGLLNFKLSMAKLERNIG